MYCYIDKSYGFSNAHRKINVSEISWSNFSIMNHETNTLLLNIEQLLTNICTPDPCIFFFCNWLLNSYNNIIIDVTILKN